jgi:hypothetical protein
MHVEQDVGIPDLIRQLGNDSRRLFADEVKLAKLEMHEGVSTGAHAAVWLGLAFGVAIAALVAFTLFLSTLLGSFLSGHMWFGVAVTGVVELIAAGVFIKRGLSNLKEPSYSLEQTRESVAETKHWASQLH